MLCETNSKCLLALAAIKEREREPLFNTHLIDADDLEEINKITEMLNPDEKILLVAKQSRIKPGGSVHTPNIIYARDRRIIIRDPYMLGIRENVIDIPYDIITSVNRKRKFIAARLLPCIVAFHIVIIIFFYSFSFFFPTMHITSLSSLIQLVVLSVYFLGASSATAFHISSFLSSTSFDNIALIGALSSLV